MARKEDGFTWHRGGFNRPASAVPKSGDVTEMPPDIYDSQKVAGVEEELNAIKAGLPPTLDSPSEVYPHLKANGTHNTPHDLGTAFKQSGGSTNRTEWRDPAFHRASGVRPAANGSLRDVGAIPKPRKLTDRIADMRGQKLPASEIPATINGVKKEANTFSIPVEKRPAYDRMAEDFPRHPDTDPVQRTREILRSELRALTEEEQGIVDGRKAHTDEGRKRLETITAEKALIRKTLSLLRGRQRAGAVDFETVPTDKSGRASTDVSHEATDPYLPPGFDQDPPTRFPYQATSEDIARQEAEQRGAPGISEPGILERSVGEGTDNPPIEPAENITRAFRRAEKPRTERPDSGVGFLQRLQRESERPVPGRDSELESTQTLPRMRFGRVGTGFTEARERIGKYFDDVEERAGARRGPTFREVLEKRRTNRQQQFIGEGEQVMAKNPVFEHVLRHAKWSDEDILKFTEALGAKHLQEQSWLLNEIEGGVVFKIGRKRKEILKKGMRIIREHMKAQEREAQGRAKMSEAEKVALEAAVENGTILDGDARDYAALRAGWFASIGYTARRRELNRLVRPILEPIWEENYQKNLTAGRQRLERARRGQVIAPGPVVVPSNLGRSRDLPVESELLQVPAFTPINRNLLLMAVVKERLPQATYDTYAHIWTRDNNKGVPIDDVEKDAVRAVLSIVQ